MMSPEAIGHTRWAIAEGYIPSGTDYASLIEADVPVVVQHTRLDSRQADNALMTTIAFGAD